MSIKRDYYVETINYSIAMNVIVRCHYLHRKCPCSFAFGLFKDSVLYGVIIYGTPSSAPLRSGICGPSQKNNVIELTRLWVDDSVPKNGESYLIGNTLPLLNKEIVVSFADISVGHIGTIYQATNWIYTGLSAKRTDWHVAGNLKHGQTWADKYTSKEIRAKFGDMFCLKDRPRKHRYIYIRGNKRRKNELISMLRYPVLKYPKQH